MTTQSQYSKWKCKFALSPQETSYILLLKRLETLSISGVSPGGHFLCLILIRSNTLMRALAHCLGMFLSIRHITVLRDLKRTSSI